MAGTPPYVSIVLTGRNDGYGGDFVSRFLATLRFNLRELAIRGIEHEVVLVEWAPPEGAPLLADLADERLPRAPQALRAIAVDPAYHDAVTQNPRLAYHEFIAKNVGIRRARGEYIITTNCDVFLGRCILETLQRRAFRSGVVYRAARHDLYPGAAHHSIDWSYLEDPGHLAGPAKPLIPPFFARGSGDFIALDRRGFDRVRGFNEVFRAARIGIDRNFLVQALSCGLSIVDVGGPVYHVNHEGSFRITQKLYEGREWEAPYGDARWPSGSVVYRNHAAWGLAGAPERETAPRRTRLEFSWDAVPPLVMLDRVVLPVARTATATPKPHTARRPNG